MTAITATKSFGAATDGSGISIGYHVLKVPQDESPQTYSVAGQGGKVSLVSVFGFVPAGRSVEIVVGGIQLFFVKALSTDSIIDFKRQTDELAAELSAGSTNAVINFGTLGSASDILTVVLATPL